MNYRASLLKELAVGLWHSTSIVNYDLIISDGAISPNVSRRRNYDLYCCQEIGAVSLFDFERPTEAQRIKYADHKWESVISGHRPVSVLLGFTRTELPGELVYYPDMKVNTKGNIIPYVEVCHKGPIPLSCLRWSILLAPDLRVLWSGTRLSRDQIASTVTHASADGTQNTLCDNGTG
jgi:hypothetical protein